MLERIGPAEGRPLVDTIAGSSISNMAASGVGGKSEIRILFAFDLWRSAIVLIAGDRAGQWRIVVDFGDKQLKVGWSAPRLGCERAFGFVHAAGILTLTTASLWLLGRTWRMPASALVVALRGAFDLIAQAGGGVVEAYPQDTQGKKISTSFLYNGTRALFEDAGFRHQRPKGKNHTVMRTTVELASYPAGTQLGLPRPVPRHEMPMAAGSEAHPHLGMSC